MDSTAAVQSISSPLTITTPSGSTDDRSVTLVGTLIDGTGASVLGRSVEIDEGGVALGTAAVDADGHWLVPVLLQDIGANTLQAETVGPAGQPITSAPVVLTLDTVTSPTSGPSQSATPPQRVFPAHGAEVSGEGGPLTFVFRPHPGHAVVDDFALSGSAADHLSLPRAVFNDVSDVLRHTTMAGGNAVIHLSPSDSITLPGVSKAALRAERSAFLFHG